MQKWELAKLYSQYLWKKCSRTTFYDRMRRWYDVTSALKPATKESFRTRPVRTKKFAEELEWYHKQKWAKPSRTRFYQRLYQWWTKEEAIKLDAPIHRTFKYVTKKNCYIRQKNPIVKKKENKDYYGIKIRYPREEANVIAKEYIRMIDELEDAVIATDDVSEVKELNDKIERLKNEYEMSRFLNY